MIIVQPAANAGANFQACMSSGKFQGMIMPTTPTGWSHVKQKVLKLPCVGWITLPPHLSAMPA